MSIDTINMKGDYADPTIIVSDRGFNIKNIEKAEPLTISYRKKSSQEKKEHFHLKEHLLQHSSQW